MKLRDLDIARISRAFSPAKEIEDPQLFAGRKTEIEAGMRALSNREAFFRFSVCVVWERAPSPFN